MLGFVGSPWTLATYIIEGKSSALYKTIKTMMHNAPDVLHALLSHLADQIATYACFQISSGADAVQLFDSWGGQLPPQVQLLPRFSQPTRSWQASGGRASEAGLHDCLLALVIQILHK